MLRQSVTIYAADHTTVLASASSAGAYGGTTLTLTVNNVSPLQTFYIKVSGADATAFGTGAYGMALNFGSGTTPSISTPNTQVANGNPLQSGGGQYEQSLPTLGGGENAGLDIFDTKKEKDTPKSHPANSHAGHHNGDSAAAGDTGDQDNGKEHD